MACNKNSLEEIKEVGKVFLKCFLAVESFTLDPLVLKCLHLRCEAVKL